MSVILVDIVSKWLMVERGSYALNRGVAFNLVEGISISGAVVVLMVFILMFWSKLREELSAWGVLLIVAGGIANIFSRFLWGGVVDWINIVGVLPEFNLADVAIVGGALVTGFSMLKEKKHEYTGNI